MKHWRSAVLMNAIDPQRWSRLRALLDRALDLDEAARAQFVASLSRDDASLHDDLQRLLRQHAHDERQPSINPYALAAPLILGDALASVDESRVGQQIGGYRLLRLIGSGGMGSVYLAERSEETLQHRVALKVIRNEAVSADTRERFERERQILARLVHPHIAPLYDGGQTPDGQPFYTMEYVDGVAVTDYCREHLANDVPARVRLLIDIAGALACAHQNLIVHRDIKPSNILVSADGCAKLLDFGIAKALGQSGGEPTRAALGPMTPEYAAPEQFRNGTVTVATDVYQFGVLCYRILGGRLPYRADPADAYAWSRAVAEEEPISLRRAVTLEASPAQAPVAGQRRARRQLGSDLDAILRKALAKSPAERYRSMDAMGDDLLAFVERRPVSARSAGPFYVAWRTIARWPYVSAAACAGLIVLVGLLLLAQQQTRIARHEATRANAVAKFLVGMFQVADPAVNRGEHLNANEILARGAARIDKDFADDAAQRAALQTVIGEVYSSLGDFPRARVPLEAAAESWRSAGADFERATTLRSLAWVIYRQGNAAEALQRLDQALSLLDPAMLRNADELAQLHSYRALALQASGNTDAALLEFHSAYSYAERAGVAETMRGASIQNNLGLLLRERGDFAAAETALRLAWVNYGRELGEDHFRSISTAQNLGLVLLDLNRLDEAQLLTDGASERIRVQYGENNADYATAMNTRGNVARRRGDSARALEIYAQSETAFRAALGDRHWYVSWPMFNAGLALLDQRDAASALKRFDAVLALRRATLDADNPAVSEALQGRSEALFGLGRNDEALSAAQQALDIDRAKLPSGHPELIHALWLIGQVQFLRGERASAKSYWDEALAGAGRTYGQDSSRFRRLAKITSEPAARVREPAD